MVIIPESQVALMRKRRQLKKMIEAGDWASVAALEKELYLHISRAAEDPQRSPKELLTELRDVIGLYKELTTICNQFSAHVN